MRQIDNINLVVYLEKVLKEISEYGIDVTFYEEELHEAISSYEKSKEQEYDRSIRLEALLTSESDFELNLAMKLNRIEAQLRDYVLFLDLVHSTNDWKIDFDIDGVFFKFSGRRFNLLGFNSPRLAS